MVQMELDHNDDKLEDSSMLMDGDLNMGLDENYIQAEMWDMSPEEPDPMDLMALED